MLSSPSSSTVARRSGNLWFNMPEALWWMSRRLALNLDRLKCHKRQRYVGKCGGKIEVELRIRLGGMEEEVKDTINVFGRGVRSLGLKSKRIIAEFLTWR